MNFDRTKKWILSKKRIEISNMFSACLESLKKEKDIEERKRMIKPCKKS